MIEFGDPRLPARFWSKVWMAPDGCWLWTAAKGGNGYGRFMAERRNQRAHRYAYEQLFGSLPSDVHVDHVCHDPATCTGGRSCAHRLCVNPAHLAPATGAWNSSPSRSRHHERDKTHCVNGHPFDAANTIHNKYQRVCRECRRAVRARYNARNPRATR